MSMILTSRRRAVVIALLTGVLFTATGHLLAHIGGWRPGGTGAAVGKLGATLIAWPLLRGAMSILPGLEPLLVDSHSPIVRTTILIAFPVIFWATLVFLTLLTGSRLRRRVERGRPPTEL
jgi:hypothetical protein